MKHLLRLIKRWRYRRLFHKLFWVYLKNPETSSFAVYNATQTFSALTGLDYQEEVGEW